LLALWVLSPFVALLWAHILLPRWSVLTRATLYAVMLSVALGSLIVYTADAIWPRTSQGAFLFIVVPPASWLLSAAAVLIAAFISHRRSRRANGILSCGRFDFAVRRPSESHNLRPRWLTRLLQPKPDFASFSSWRQT